jgi:DNA invertase Pin-like site-specific DNA recombinase
LFEERRLQRIYREKITGAYRDRPELNRMLDQLREGDTVTVWKLDRLARSTRNLLEIVETIRPRRRPLPIHL